MNWQYTPYTMPLIIAVFADIVLLAHMWQRRRDTRGALPFVALMLAIIEWSFVYALELSAVDLAAKVFFSKLEYLGIVSVSSAWFVFALQYSHHKTWRILRTAVLLSFEPVVMLILTWTNELHGQVWSGISLQSNLSFVTMQMDHGFAFWLHIVYSYGLFLAGCGVLFQNLWRARTIYRAQLSALLIAAAAPWIANLLTLIGVSPFLDLTPFGFMVTGLATAWGLFRFQLLSLTPMARDIVMESMTDAVIILDDQYRVIDLNPASYTLLKVASDEAMGQPFSQGFGPEISALIEGYKATFDCCTEIAIGEGLSARHFDTQISPVSDSHNGQSGHVILLHDISDRKRAEEALQLAHRVLQKHVHQLEAANAAAEEANRLKGEFIASISHELRTPLASIKLSSSLLLDERMGSLNLKQRTHMDMIIGNNDWLIHLINDFLDLSRLEAGRMEIDLLPYDPRQMLENVRRQNSALFESRTLDFQVELAASLPNMVIGDCDRVKQIVINLLSNAAKFTLEGRVVLKAFAPTSDCWQIEVSDTGLGIAPDQQELIFQPFRQIKGSAANKATGSGLGLAIVREMCRQMNGSIRVESAPGRGSTFFVTLPTGLAKQGLGHQPLLELMEYSR